ncbi:MAG: outer membrane protein [Bacteriovoracaceae bacterium]|jgi:outer membrane protein
MKNLVLIAALLLSFSAIAEVKVGIVNIQKIIVTIKEGKTVNKTLEKSFKKKQELIKSEEAGIRKLQEKFQKQTAVLTDAAKAKKGAEIKGKIDAVRAKMMQFQKDIQKEEAELKKPILDKLKPIIDAISASEKVALTFEISQSPVVYASNKVDLTEKVIQAYDKKHSK